MSDVLEPRTPADVADAVRSMPRLLAVGAGTKPRLSAVDAPRLKMTGLNGVLEYEPSEFTFTALAGTPVRNIAAILAERGQYLPFDPMLVAAGATLGGTVASGLSGPGRFRFGGLRDFILGVRFVDGGGRLLRLGGKVVKNSAGFDVPKFFVGSLGRFGVLTELTFKVFPRPASAVTLRLPVADLAKAVAMLPFASAMGWEPDALDLPPGDRCVYLRLAAPESALSALASKILACLPGEVLEADCAARRWAELGEFRWVHPGGCLAKIVLTPSQVVPLDAALRRLDDARLHVSAGGNVAFVSLPDSATTLLDVTLRDLGLRGVTLHGKGPLWLGVHDSPAISLAVKQALDPQNRFPTLDD